MTYFGDVSSIAKERCDKIISKSCGMLVEYDSFFEWFKETAMELLNDILSEIDKSLSSVGCGYSVTTKH